MRISKITWIILGVVVFAVVAGVLYMMYNRQQTEQDQLRAQISAKQATLAKLVAERTSTQAQLTKVQADLTQKKADLDAVMLSLSAVKAEWPGEAESIEYDQKLFALADGWDLVINVVQAGETAAQSTGGISFNTNTYSVSITNVPLTAGLTTESEYETYVYAAVDDILGFVTTIVNDDAFKTASIDLVSLTVPPMISSDEVVDQGTEVELPAANITVTVFTYKGG